MGATKKMLDTEFEQVEQILEEAARFNLRYEVQETALYLLKQPEYKNLTLSQIYDEAYKLILNEDAIK